MLTYELKLKKPVICLTFYFPYFFDWFHESFEMFYIQKQANAFLLLSVQVPVSQLQQVPTSQPSVQAQPQVKYDYFNSLFASHLHANEKNRNIKDM